MRDRFVIALDLPFRLQALLDRAHTLVNRSPNHPRSREMRALITGLEATLHSGDEQAIAPITEDLMRVVTEIETAGA